MGRRGAPEPLVPEGDPVTGFSQSVLRDSQKQLLGTLGPVARKRGFYLGGGTAVALHLGHRRSEDFDWFTSEAIGDPLQLAGALRSDGLELDTLGVDRGTLHAEAGGVRLSFLEYRYPLLRPVVEWADYSCRIAALEDLACMKLSAISRRGEKKDFVDLYAMAARGWSLSQMLEMYREKFDMRDVGHVLRSLIYFDEADETAMPAMLVELDWSRVRKDLTERVKAFVRSQGRGSSSDPEGS